jgi:alpha-L-fucosidase
MLCEYVSSNGNLLINVGPKADGTIPQEQIARLRDLGAWLKRHGEAIYATRPCERCHSEKLDKGATVYYTQKGRERFAILCGLAPGTHTVRLPAWGVDVAVDVQDNMPVHTRIEGGM